MATMKRAIAAQQTEMDALKTLVENNKKEVLRTMDTKLTSLKTQIHEEARTKEKIDQDRAAKATKERAAAALQIKMMYEMLTNFSLPPATARPASPLPPTPTPTVPEAALNTPLNNFPQAQAPAPSPSAPTPLRAQAQDPPRLRAPTPIITFPQPPSNPGGGRGRGSGRGQGDLHRLKHPRSTTAGSPSRTRGFHS